MIRWKRRPEAHDYPAAASYLTLVYQGRVRADKLRKAYRKHGSVMQFKSKDLLRAAGLAPLGPDSFHVRADITKVMSGTKLVPLLLVSEGDRLTIADGFHRMCAVHVLDEDALVPCLILDRDRVPV